MNKKSHIKEILLIVSGMLLSAALVIGLTGSHKEHASRLCRRVEVEITDSSNKFFSNKEIIRILEKDFGGIVNRPVDSLNLFKMEKILFDAGRIRKNDAFFTGDGILHVKVTLSEPVAKMINGEVLYYVDEEGRHYRMKNDWKPELLTVSGGTVINDKKWMKELSRMAMEIENSSGWKERISRLECREDGELDLLLVGRPEKFHIGTPSDIGDKLEKIETYLNEILPNLEDGKNYSTVNLKFKGQIVCR